MLNRCMNAIYHKPYKMAEMVEFSTETSNLVIKESKTKRQVSLQMNVRNGVQKDNGNIELTSIMSRVVLDIKYLYKCSDMSERYSYQILEYLRKIILEKEIRRSLSQQEYKQVYGVLYN